MILFDEYFFSVWDWFYRQQNATYITNQHLLISAPHKEAYRFDLIRLNVAIIMVIIFSGIPEMIHAFGLKGLPWWFRW